MAEAGANGTGPAAGRSDAAAAPAPAAPVKTAQPAPSPVTDLGAARTLVRRLAPHLGLEPDSVPLRVAGPQHATALGAARAAASADGILLRPSALAEPDPALLAHELAHIAQHRNRTAPAPIPAPRPARGRVSDHTLPLRPSVTAAESEAAALADAARYGTPLWRPLAVLPSGHLARDIGATGAVASRPVGSVPGTAPPSSVSSQPDVAENPADDRGDVAGLASYLQYLVKDTHAAERDRISSELHSFWETSSEARSYTLSLIEQLPFVVARALIGTLEPDQRQRLARVNADQFKAHPGACVAVLSALDGKDIEALGGALTSGTGSALYGATTDQLDPTILRALYSILHRLTQPGLLQLLDTDRRDFFRALLKSVPPAGTEEFELKAAVADEQRRHLVYQDSIGTTGTNGAQNTEAAGLDAAIVTKIRDALSDHSALAARRALTLLEPLTDMVRATPGADPHPAVLADIQPGERLRTVVGELDRDKLVDVILDNLPAADRYPTKTGNAYAAILTTILKARAPGFTLPRIESLLSYGVFDWAITDAEAQFADLLVHSLPPDVQDEWRRRDGGKWFHRLEDNLPDGTVASGGYQGVGSEFTVDGADAAKDEPEVMKLFSWAVDEWKEGEEKNAITIVDRFAGASVADATLQTPVPRIVAGAIRRLDATGQFDKILAKLPGTYLTDVPGRHRVDQVASMRDPVHNQLQAADLISGNIFGIAGDHDFWLARLLLRSMPPREQQRFGADHPSAWGKMEFLLTPQMRQNDSNQALTGRDGFPTLDQLHKRLMDKSLWTAGRVMQLRALIDLAYASDDREFVFEQSRKFAAYNITGLLPLVRAFNLFEPGKTFEHAPMDTPNGLQVLGRVITEFGKMSLVLLDWGLQLLSSSLGHTMHVALDLDEVQWAMGSDVYGAEFDTARKPTPPRPAGSPPPISSAMGAGPNPKAQPQPQDNTNRILIDLDPGTGAFRIRLPELRLNRLNLSTPGSSYRTGAIELRGLEIIGSISDTHYREPSGVEVSLASADVQDLVVGSPGGAFALADVLASALKFKAGQTGQEDLKGDPPRPGTINVLIFGPLLQALENLTALGGGIPGDFTLLDFALMPLTAGMSLPASELLSHTVDFAVPTPKPGDYLYGMISDGAFRPPRGVADRAKDAVGMLRSMQVSLNRLTITGASFGADTQGASIVLADLSAGLATSTPAYLRAQIASLTRRIALLQPGPEHDAAVAEQAVLQAKLDAMRGDETRLHDLEAKDRWINGSLSDPERAELVRLNKELRSDVGVVLDVGSLTVGETTGRMEIAGAKVGRTHLEARLPAEAMPALSGAYLDDKSLVQSFTAAGDAKPVSPAKIAAATDLKLTVAGAELLPNPSGGPMIRINGDNGSTWQAKTAKVGAITADIDSATGTATGRIADVDIEDFTTGPGGYGFHKASGSIDLIPLNLKGLPDQGGGSLFDLLHPKLSANLDFEKVTTPFGEIEQIRIAGLSGSPQPIDGGVHIPDLGIAAMIVSGLNLDAGGGHIAGENSVLITGVLMDATVTGGTTHIQNLTINSISGENLVYTQGDDSYHVTATLKSGELGDIRVPDLTFTQSPTGTSVVTGQATVGQADVRFGAVATVFGPKPPGKKAAPKPKTYTVDGEIGTADPQAAGPALSVGFASGTDHDKISLDLNNLEALGLKFTSPDGSLTIVHTGIGGSLTQSGPKTTATVSLTDFDLLSNVNWHSATASITSHGHTHFKSVTVEGSYTKDPPKDPAKDSPDAKGKQPSDTAVLDISKLTATGFDTSDLHYHDSSGDSPLDIALGELGPHQGAMRAREITLTDFHLPLGPGRAGLASGKLNILGAHLEASVIAGALKARGSIDAKTISVTFSHGGDYLTARATGLGGELDIHGDGWSGQGQISPDADSGLITVSPGEIRVQGLSIPHTSLAALTVDTESPNSFHLKMSERSLVTATGLGVDLRIDRRTSKVVITRLHLDEIAGDGLTITLPDSGMMVTIPHGPIGDLAKITNIDLLPAEGKEGFEVTPGGLQKALGTVKLEQLLLPRVKVDVADTFHGSVHLKVGPSSLGLLEHGSTKIKVSDITGGILGVGNVGPGPDSIMIEKFFAKEVEVDDGAAKVTGLGAEGLEYSNLGVHLTVKHTEPFDGDFTKKSAKIPKVRVTDGYLTVDFAYLSSGSGSGSSSGGGPTMSPTPRALAAMLLNRLTGSIPLSLLAKNIDLGLPALRDISADAPITLVTGPAAVGAEGGVVDVADLRRSIVTSLAITPSIPGAGTAADHADFDVEDGTTLVFELFGITVFSWRPTDPLDRSLLTAMPNHPMIRLGSLVTDLLPPSSTSSGSSTPLPAVEAILGASCLTLAGKDAIKIELSGGPDGHITLAKDVVTDFAVSSGFLSTAHTAGAVRGIDLKHFGIENVDLRFGAQHLETGTIRVDGAKDGVLKLTGTSPAHLEISITSAEADNIEWHKP